MADRNVVPFLAEGRCGNGLGKDAMVPILVSGVRQFCGIQPAVSSNQSGRSSRKSLTAEGKGPVDYWGWGADGVRLLSGATD
jgi:hypothetical protein